MALEMNLLAGNEKQANARKVVGLVSELVGTKGQIEITPSSLYGDKQKVLDITSNDGKLFSFVCDYKLSELLHNKAISMTDLGAMEIAQVALMNGPDKGKLVNKVLLPQSWKQTITISAKDLKKAEEVQAKSLFVSDQLASW
jgi:hypothetical protein